MDAIYPIRAVSKLTGLSIDTLRAWERRYKAIVPERTERGRQYSAGNVHRLILLRKAVECGHSISQVAVLPDAELQNLLASGQPTGRKNVPGASIVSLVDAFGNFEVTQANDELGRQAALLSPRDLVFSVVLPLMREVGERWRCGLIGIAQEHLVSSAVRNLFGSLVRLYPPRPGAPKIVIATLSGELHEFGILAAAMISAINGMNPLLLGPNLPVDELLYAAKKTSASVVVVGCSGAPASPADLEKLAAGLPPESELWVGGPAHESETPDVASRFVRLADMEAFERACLLRGTPVQ